MPTVKNDRLVVRISPDLKKKIEAFAAEKGKNSSEFVREILEGIVFEKQKKIENIVSIIDGITHFLNQMLLNGILAKNSASIKKHSKDVYNYQNLLHTHQLRAIELISEEIEINDKKIKALKRDIKLVLEKLNNYLDEESEIDSYMKSDDKIDFLEQQLFRKADKLYRYVLEKYRRSQHTH